MGGTNDDSLGKVQISANKAGVGTLEANFHDLQHAFYVLEYTVTDDTQTS